MTDEAPGAGPTPAPLQKPDRFNLIEACLARGLETSPDKPALIVASANADPEIYSYTELQRLILSAHEILSSRLERGERLIVDLGHCSLFPIVFFGAISAGLVPVPLSDQLSAAERAFIVRDSGARLAICHHPDAYQTSGCLCLTPEDFSDAKSSAAFHLATGSNDPAFLIYTSGTSGRPKGVLHAHRSLIGRRPMIDHWFALNPSDRLLHAGAFNWTYTLGVGLIDPWSIGATSIVYTGDKHPSLWPDLIERYAISLFAAVPSLYRRMLKYATLSPERMPSLRHGLCAGESLPASLLDNWRQTTGRALYEALGMSECSTYISSSPHRPVRPGSAGHIQPGRAVTILNEDSLTSPAATGETGLIAIHRSEPGLMLGYWDGDTQTPKPLGEWFLTGDRARRDEDGYIWHEGRADDVMNAFGYRVAAEEVERALSSHPSLEEVAVTTTITETHAELITAFVIVKSGYSFDQDALERHAAERLADYKRPKRWKIIENFPRTPSGKLVRKRLKDVWT